MFDKSFEFAPFLLSFKLALFATLILLALCIPLALLLSYRNFKGKFFVESVLTLPLILPPTVIGFYLLMAFSPRYFFGGFIAEHTGLTIPFSFFGIVVASCIHSLPFMLQPLKNGFSVFDSSLIDASFTLGRSRFQTFRCVIFPSVFPFLLSGVLMTFVHVMGEFGVILMIGGSVPGVTRVASIALYERVDAMDYSAANRYALFLILISFSVIALLSYLQKRRLRHA